jgi:hypothetical protein
MIDGRGAALPPAAGTASKKIARDGMDQDCGSVRHGRDSPSRHAIASWREEEARE